MATGCRTVEKKQLNLQDCLGVVEKISKEVSNCEDSSVPISLLGLLPCLEAGGLSAKESSLVENKIWKDDLVHIMIEVLRNDYSMLEEHWRILTNLSITLASVLAGLSPKLCEHEPSFSLSTSMDSEAKQVKEFYEMILPTAVDSILILANSILEAADDIQTNPAQESPANLQACFKKTLGSLLWVCASHQQCITRTVQSPYFLHTLITDNVFYNHVALGALERLILSGKSSISSIPQNVLKSILDELVYKISGKEETGALLSLKLLAQFVALAPQLMAVLTQSYSGLLELVRRLVKPEQMTIGPTEKNLIAWLESQKVFLQDGEGGLDRIRAAVVIQACWRGHSCRKMILNMKRGIRNFQKLYRRRKEEKDKRKELEVKAKTAVAVKQRALMNSQLAFHKKQLSLYEQLPASELQEFIKRQEFKAAVRIQSAWRAWLVHSKYKERKSKALLDKSASVVQRTLHRNMQQKGEETKDVCNIPILPEITGEERERLQHEVDHYRDLHMPCASRLADDVHRLHDQVQKMYEDFYLSRATQSRSDKKAQLLTSQLNSNCKLLLGAPSLEESVTRPRPDLVESLLSRSASVARMARTAHREEMKALNTPWWKRAPLDHDELVL